MGRAGFTWNTTSAAAQQWRMLTSYRRVLTRDLRYLFVASIVGRLPIGMSGLAILLLVQGTSGSFAIRGAATGRSVARLACAGPATARVTHPHGPRTQPPSRPAPFPRPPCA